MATGATTVLARWPRRSVLLGVLVISLVLNTFFVAGAVWTRFYPRPTGFEQRFERMGSELNLDARQRAAFDRYVAAMRTRGEKLRRELGSLFGTAWEEMAKPQANTTEI